MQIKRLIKMMDEENLDKLYYPIGEVASILNVNASLIRFWEKEFPGYIHPRKNRNGKRMFSQKDIAILKEIHFLIKEQRYTLEGAKNLLSTSKKNIDKEIYLTNTLKKLRSLLLEIRDKINK